MKLLYDLQKYALSEKMTQIKVVGVMKDFWWSWTWSWTWL